MPHFEYASHRLFYRDEGAGSPLVLLPGNTSASAHFVGEVQYFAPSYHTVALDFYGTGRSGRNAAWPDDWFEQMAAEALALVDHLAQGPAILVGTSGGGIVALLAAILGPQQVRAVIADSCVELYPPEWLDKVIATRQAATPEQAAFWQLGHGKDWKKVVDADSDMLTRFAGLGGDPFAGRLPDVQCPVLLTASVTDELLPDAMRQVRHMVRQIPRGRALFFAGGSHPSIWSRAADFRRAASSFLSSID